MEARTKNKIEKIKDMYNRLKEYGYETLTDEEIIAYAVEEFYNYVLNLYNTSLKLLK